MPNRCTSSELPSGDDRGRQLQRRIHGPARDIQPGRNACREHVHEARQRGRFRGYPANYLVPRRLDPGLFPATYPYPRRNSPIQQLLLPRQGRRRHSSNPTLSKAEITASTTSERKDDRWLRSTALRNTSKIPALFVRVQMVREHTVARITPAIYDSNYVALMPNKSRTITTECLHKDTRGENPSIIVKGLNVAPGAC
ncbi:MAG: hypothetical protein ACRYFU_22035 [Janthinobacterium lividum]